MYEIMSSSSRLIRNLDMSNSRESFASDAEFKTNSVRVLYSSGPHLCIGKCVWPGAAGDERFGQDVERAGLRKEGCLMWFAWPPITVGFSDGMQAPWCQILRFHSPV